MKVESVKSKHYFHFDFFLKRRKIFEKNLGDSFPIKEELIERRNILFFHQIPKSYSILKKVF